MSLIHSASARFKSLCSESPSMAVPFTQAMPELVSPTVWMNVNDCPMRLTPSTRCWPVSLFHAWRRDDLTVSPTCEPNVQRSPVRASHLALPPNASIT